MSPSNPVERKERWRLADELLELARVDTAYADLYFQRGRELLGSEMTEAQFASLKDMDAEAPLLQNRIANAMEIGEWPKVQELTARLSELKRTLAERQGARGLAERTYGPFEPLVDAFSPGIHGLAGVAEQDLPALREQGVRRLERLRDADSDWRELYEARRAAMAAMTLGESASSTSGAAPAARLRAQAQAALVSGDLTRLQKLAGELTAAQAEAAASGQPAAPGAGSAFAPPPDLDYTFDERVRERALELGLAPSSVPSTFRTVVEKFRPSWRPTLATDAGGSTLRLTVSLPSDAPEPLRDSVEMLMNRPFITSAGTRYMPWFVREDLLLEGFEETALESAPRSLLDALRLPSRTGLSRRVIEEALRSRGGAVVSSLGLDPRAFRLVCVPLDVYTRAGEERGWGKRELWTHYDGYMATKERKLMALAGGDVRFGGRQDLVAVGIDYDSDRLVARFAVVQRRRFATW